MYHFSQGREVVLYIKVLHINTIFLRSLQGWTGVITRIYGLHDQPRNRKRSVKFRCRTSLPSPDIWRQTLHNCPGTLRGMKQIFHKQCLLFQNTTKHTISEYHKTCTVYIK